MYQDKKPQIIVHNFKELKVWQKSLDFASEIYKLTKEFPAEEKYGLISQLRRAAVSIPANIAEGSGRRTDKDFNNFFGKSLGSAFELETELIITLKLGLITSESFEKHHNVIIEIQKMTVGLQNSLNLEQD